MKQILILGSKSIMLYIQHFEKNFKINTFKSLSYKCAKYELNYLHVNNVNIMDIVIILDNTLINTLENLLLSDTSIKYIFSLVDLKVKSDKIKIYKTIKISNIIEIIGNTPNIIAKESTQLVKESTQLVKKSTQLVKESTQLVQKSTQLVKESNESVYYMNLYDCIFDTYKIFCINLEKDIERKEFIQLQTFKYDITFVDAIYGKNLKQITLNNYIKRSKKNMYSNDHMNQGEIGCLLSHIKVFEMSKDIDDYIIVFEDDIDIKTLYNKKISNDLLNLIKKESPECIQLCIICDNQDNMIDITNNNLKLIDWNTYNNKYSYGCFWSTGAYIVSKKARTELLNIFYKNGLLLPADFYIYKNLDTKTLFPPLIIPNYKISTTIHNNEKSIMNMEYKSNILLKKKYNNKKLILLTLWYGKLPSYLDLWFSSVNNKNYDILFITDQNINIHPVNVKILYIELVDLLKLIKKHINIEIESISLYKLVDLKPMLGYLFQDFIIIYDYWGWTDIDMIMGNIDNDIDTDFDVISYGFNTFGPITLFKTSLTHLYKQIDRYEHILKDEYICKVDEPWFFDRIQNIKDGDIVSDQGIMVKYYSGTNLSDIIQKLKVKKVSWDNFCCNIDWNIKTKLKQNKWFEEKYSYKLNKLYLKKNDKNISFCHLTQLKTDKNFLASLKNIDYTKNIITIDVKYKSMLTTVDSLINNALDNMIVTDIYKNYIQTNIMINNIDLDNRKTIDFTTIFFMDDLELNLLKLQAYSFKFVDPKIINNIILFFQEMPDINYNFNEIINYYPEYLQQKVKIIHFKDTNLSLSYFTNKWQLQQLNKILLFKYVNSEHYCILDAKNHFIKDISEQDFFKNDCYYIYTSPDYKNNNFYYRNCMKYFTGIEKDNIKNISMSTPFIFHKKSVNQMVRYIENREKKSFDIFFMNNLSITEFYLYSSFIEFKELKNAKYREIMHTSIYSDPNEEWSLRFLNDKLYLNENWKIFGLHRKSIDKMDSSYKSKLLEMYETIYGKDCKLILTILYG